MIKTRGNNPILTLKPNIFLHNSSTSTSISFKPSGIGFHFMRRSKQGVTTLYLLLNLTFSFISHQHQLWFLSNLHNRVSFYKMFKTRGNNPILTLKPNILLHISLTSTLISFKPSGTGFHCMRRSKQGVTTLYLL